MEMLCLRNKKIQFTKDTDNGKNKIGHGEETVEVVNTVYSTD